MWVMGLIMKGCIPFQIRTIYFIILCKELHPASDQVLPLGGTVISETFCILPSEAYHVGPDDSRMVRQIINIVSLFSYDVQIVL